MNFKQWLLNEMPIISLQGKTVLADDKPLKDVDVDNIKNNLVFFRLDKDGLWPKGTFWIYFMESEQSADDMKQGKIKMLQVPYRGISTIWTKKYATEGTEKILGYLHGVADEDAIRIDHMTVRPKYKQNTINSKMINLLKSRFPNAKIIFDSPTEQGKKFISKYTKEIKPT